MKQYEELTKYLSIIENGNLGNWLSDNKGKGTLNNPLQMPLVSYPETVENFISDVYLFVENHPEKRLNNYQHILEQNNIKWNKQSMQDVDVSKLDANGVMALILGAVRAERFCDGALLSFFKNGLIRKCLMRLEEIEEE